MKLYPVLAILCGAFMFSSCYKVEVEANDLPQGYSVAQIIGTWKITGVTSNKPADWDGNGTNETNVYSTWSDCLKDNLYQFNSNYSAAYKLNCNDTKQGIWRLDGTVTLVWSPDGASSEFEKIVSMTSNSMKTEITTFYNGDLFTLTKQWSLQ